MVFKQELSNIKRIFINFLLFLNWNFFKLIFLILKEILSNKIIMAAFADYISITKVFLNNFTFYYSRGKNFFWFKGFYSKNFQLIKFFYIDCDMDIIIFKIFQIYKLSCHTNNLNCKINKETL